MTQPARVMLHRPLSGRQHARRQRIVGAAMRLAAAGGYDAVRMKRGFGTQLWIQRPSAHWK